jgi:hypothetical protein
MTRQTRSHLAAGIAALLTANACPLAGSASAATAAEAAAPPETIVLKAAHVFDATGTALRDGGLIVVRGDRIVSVGGTVPVGRVSSISETRPWRPASSMPTRA